MTSHLGESRWPKTVPVLALDEHVLLPSVATPFRVTAPAQRALVDDASQRPLDQRWVAVPARPAGADLGTLGLLTVATPLAGGDYIIVVEGRSACRLERVLTDRGGLDTYELAHARLLADRPEPLAAARRETTALVQALFSLYDAFFIAAAERSPEVAAIDHGVDDAGLVFRIAASVIDEPRRRAALLAERCPARRRAVVFSVIADQLAFAQKERLLGRSPVAC